MSMDSIFLDVHLDFSSRDKRWRSEEILLRILGLICVVNKHYLAAHPEVPRLYASGVKYCPPDQMDGCWVDQARIPELRAFLRQIGAADDKIAILERLVSGAEIFQDVENLYKSGHGDCDRLVCARVAELWLAGISAQPYLVPYANDRGGTTYHAVVLHGDGTSEDPSLILGMGGRARAAERAEEIRKNYERRDNLVASAVSLMVVEDHPPEVLGAAIDAAAFVPPGGFR